MFSGMGGMGGMGGGGMFDAEEMQTEEAHPTPAREEKKPEPKPEPQDDRTPEQREAAKEKDLGNEAYKKKDFETALEHYDRASQLDPTNITYMTNKAGNYKN